MQELVAHANALLRLGISEMGASDAFDEALTVLDEAEEQLAAGDLPPATEKKLAREIEAVRASLDELIELYEDRFYRVFPLARLTWPTLLIEEGLATTEQLFHPPEVAAVMMATREIAPILEKYPHPYVVFRSPPEIRRLEIIAAEELLRDGQSTPRNRSVLISALSPESLAAFDRGELTPAIIEEITTALGAVNLLVLTIGRSVDRGDTHIRFIDGEYFQPGEVILGSAVNASSFVQVESFKVIGGARDRRAQLKSLWIADLFLLVCGLLWASRVKWNFERPHPILVRLVIGTTLLLFGRASSVVAIYVLRRVIPEPTDLVAAAWWWPAMLGGAIVIVGGLVAWIGQARLADIIPGTRGSRAVGTIFLLVTVGFASKFVLPLLLLHPNSGWASIIPFLLSTCSLALLFAFAARTGPPVPHYFAIGPVLLAPLLGIALMMASPRLLWYMASASALVCMAAVVRHRIAVARGTEEVELTAKEAAEKEREHLMKLKDKIPTKF